MSGAGQAPRPIRPEGRPLIPHWVKLAAIPVVLAVIAGLNLQAAAADRRKARAAADRVDASIVQVGGVARLGDFTLGVVITNSGSRALRLRNPRVEPSTYSLISTMHEQSVAASASTQATLDLQARCPVPSTPSSLRILLPLVTPSGRVHEVGVDVDAGLLHDLAHQACGEVVAFDAVRVNVEGVTSAQYGVSFVLTVDNSSFNRFSLVGISSPGLSFAIRGGAPVSVPERGQLLLHAVAQLPSCALLPSGGGGARFGTLQLGILDKSDVPKVVPYTPDPGGALYRALLALRSRICPGAVAVPSGTPRPRGPG